MKLGMPEVWASKWWIVTRLPVRESQSGLVENAFTLSDQYRPVKTRRPENVFA